MEAELSCPDGLCDVWRYEYDAAGNLPGSVDPTGRTAVLDYDAMNRLTSEVCTCQRSFKNGPIMVIKKCTTVYSSGLDGKSEG